MKIHIVTIGKPKFPYAKSGFELYVERLSHFHQIGLTQVADKNAYDAKVILEAVKGTYVVVLEIGGTELSSEALAGFLESRAMAAQTVSFVIGGPEGLPAEVIQQADYKWSLSPLTFPHDLAMVATAEALYRASSITAGQPYHK